MTFHALTAYDVQAELSPGLACIRELTVGREMRVEHHVGAMGGFWWRAVQGAVGYLENAHDPEWGSQDRASGLMCRWAQEQPDSRGWVRRAGARPTGRQSEATVPQSFGCPRGPVRPVVSGHPSFLHPFR